MSTSRVAVSASDVVEGVLRHFGCAREDPAPQWSALTEFAAVPGGWGTARRADIFLMRSWRSKPGHRRILVEVKVSTADLRAELACPEKMAGVGQYAHRWYLATPPGLTSGIELPAGLGLFEVTGDRCVEVLPAAARPAVDLPESFTAAVFRRAGVAEGRIRRASTVDAAAQLAQLRRELAASQAAEARAHHARDEYKQALTRWVSMLNNAEGLRCVCGSILTVKGRARRWPSGYQQHADGTECPDSPLGGTPDCTALFDRLQDELGVKL